MKNILQAFSGKKVLVIGDVMTDEYVFGRVDRISPEAPVPVVNIMKRECRPGGAANVAVNLKALGAQSVLCSVTGDDLRGHEFVAMLQEREIGSSGMLLSSERRTTVKTRVIGNNHQLLRIDDEIADDLSDDTRNLFIANCLETINRENPDVIIFEDYDKGVISKSLIDAVTAAASSRNIPVTVDPKFRNFGNYTNVTLFKPNFGELLAGTGTKINKRDTAALQQVANEFMQGRNISMMMVTLSDAGVFITDGKQGEIIAAHVRDISDVSGAGDTVISVASLSLACGLSPREVAMLANLAGGLVCEEIGVVPVNAIRFAEEASKLIE
ncbi:MAG: bifunctional heptose 7-phosphate kinase/heptose 1-phosphate adenyltransferase [Arcticibacter sp.]